MATLVSPRVIERECHVGGMSAKEGKYSPFNYVNGDLSIYVPVALQEERRKEQCHGSDIVMPKGRNVTT